MPYEGPSLAAAFGVEIERGAADLCHSLADLGGSIMTARIRELTPVGHQPFDAGYMPGALRASIRQKVVVVHFSFGGSSYESGTETDVEYSVYVEEGTGLWGPRRAKYEIRPKNPDGWLRFFDRHTGEVVFAKRVMHPGSPGHHMFAKGTVLTEPEFLQHAAERIERWSKEQEAGIQMRGLRTRIRS